MGGGLPRAARFSYANKTRIETALDIDIAVYEQVEETDKTRFCREIKTPSYPGQMSRPRGLSSGGRQVVSWGYT